MTQSASPGLAAGQGQGAAGRVLSTQLCGVRWERDVGRSDGNHPGNTSQVELLNIMGCHPEARSGGTHTFLDVRINPF